MKSSTIQFYMIKTIFVLLLFIFLFFRKDFLYGLELPHDILCPSRSDDNRRQPPAAMLIAYGLWLMAMHLTDH